LERTSFADEAWESLCSSPAGDEAESRSSMSEDGVPSGDAATACERQIETSAHAVSVNGGDGGSREIGDGIHQTLSHLREAKCFGAVQLSDFVEIGSGGKEMGIASDD
jgi:hypothetical protein